MNRSKDTAFPIPDAFIVYTTAFVCCLLLISGCSQKPDSLFDLLPPDRTGIWFVNEVHEDEYFNIISYEYLYNGAGIGIGDFNNDGLQDIFFSGNITTNRLYLNLGSLRFQDISRSAGIEGAEKWCTGVAVVDINGDGWQDIYVCASYDADSLRRKNLMFVHNGLDAQGLPSFTDKAKEMGIDDDGFSTHGVFFDADNDNDLDLYVLTNVLDTDFPNKYRPKKNDGSSVTNDRFYLNNGNGIFSNRTRESGFLYEGYGLGISIVDFNQDGWQDIYITNDYLTNDLMYINNANGTFSNKINNYLKHTSHSAMGHDIADINNDGLPDIFSLDMLPEDNQRLKQMYAGSRYGNKLEDEKYGYLSQYKRNALQLNQGADLNGNHVFSEIGLLSNIHATDWSWSALMADFDNDGYRDLFISNGYPRDVTDLDYATTGSRRGMRMSMEEELENIPVRHIHNYIFKNSGDLLFQDKSMDWGMAAPSYSNGAVYADLDNDGDLDIVAGNINEPVSVYENLLYTVDSKDADRPNYLRLKISGKKFAGIGLGCKVYAFYADMISYVDHSTIHGFISSSDPVVHIGLGDHKVLDSLWIISPDGSLTVMYDIPSNQTLDLNSDLWIHDTAKSLQLRNPDLGKPIEPLKKEFGPSYYHEEELFNDFNIQPTLPYQISESGPPLSVADIDGNGSYDLFIGGSKNVPATIYLQEKGSFHSKTWDEPETLPSEDHGSLLFDADGDGDNDLYVVSGSVEHEQESIYYQDRIYENDGSGHFTRIKSAIPAFPGPGSCVKGADMDDDGDIDLFIGGGPLPGKYPLAARSFILRNDSEPGSLLFVDVTNNICAELMNAGIIQDAIWTDFNNDDRMDLIVVGPWKPVTFFVNEGETLKNITGLTGLSDFIGWWNCLAGGDFDNDGDIDYMAGNHGLNSFYGASIDQPMQAIASDIDNNGRLDLIIGAYLKDIDGSRNLFPVHFRNDLNKQLNLIRNRFPTFKSYSYATMDSLFSEQELTASTRLTANYFPSIYIENQGKGIFKVKNLPLRAQFAPVQSILTGDFNTDTYLDALVIGNLFGNNPFWGRMDALNGLLLLGKGNGEFESIEYPGSGFFVPGDARAIVELPSQKTSTSIILVAQNQDSLRKFSRSSLQDLVPVDFRDRWAEIRFRDGAKRKQEFYYGNTCNSQSARILLLGEHVDSYKVYPFGKDVY